MHRRMLLIRGFEERVAALYRDGEVPGFVHLSIGQEAAAVGACWPLRPDGRHHVDPPRPRPLPGQRHGPARDVRRADGQGRGHEPRLWGLDAHRRPQARDLRSQRDRGGGTPHRGRSGGGGAAPAQTAGWRWRSSATARPAQGAFHEALNLAAVWELPVIFFCENNGYAEFSPTSTQHTDASRAARRRLRHPLRRGRRQRRRRHGSGDGDALVVSRPRWRWARRDRSHHVPMARPLRGRPTALPISRGDRAMGGARSTVRARAPASRCRSR